MKKFSGRRLFWILGAMALVTLLFSTGVAGASVDSIWTNGYQGSDGTNAVVAVQGSKTFVAYSNKAGNNGRVEMYDSKGIQLPSYDLGDLGGGRIAGIAVGGSKVYVAGYTGVTPNEIGFVWAFKASSKGLTYLWDGSSPDPLPYAGEYPMGIKALGSKIVLFYNTWDLGGVHGVIMGLDANTGEQKWISSVQGPNPSARVSAIAIKGSQVAVAGTTKNADGYNFFSVAEFSATTGDFLGSRGISFGSSESENEALAVAWSGSILGVAGYVTIDDTQKAYMATVNTKGWTWDSMQVDLSYGDNRFTNVVAKGSTFYAAGYGQVSKEQNEAFVRGYSAKNCDLLWEENTTMGFENGLKTTGLAVGKKGVYLSGYGESTSLAQTSWVVRAYDLKLNYIWDRNAINLNGGMFDQALDIAVGAKAVIAVGQVKNGNDSIFYAGVEAYTP
jgi:hypothetical protein